MEYGWKNEEIKSLLNLVEQNRKNNKSTMDAFVKHSKNYKRNIFSIRNFYYKKIAEIKSDEKLKDKFNINLLLHQTNNNWFNEEIEVVKKSLQYKLQVFIYHCSQIV